MSQSFFLSTFFLRAILAGSFLAISCGLLGVFLVLRKDAMISHGLSHVAFAGVALGLVLNLMPIFFSVIVALGGSFLILQLKDRARLPGDVAIGILSSAGMALAVFLSALRQDFGAELMAYLFGDILAIAPAEVGLSAALVLLVVSAIAFYYHQLVFMTFDRETASVSGLKIKKLDRVLIILTAVTIVLGIRIVGLLLVTGLTVIPAASALQLGRNFKSTLFLSTLLSLISIGGGIVLAYAFNLPASAAIIFISLTLFLLCLFLKKIS
ncbi:MAG: metal ABC transporter permease [Acidobacteriota bacterium]|nr:metal ABC transporter permease [Acidobacteriota bacterium]MDW3228584.1 metal ABC transporter permease [Acidobacteriota bacterium]